MIAGTRVAMLVRNSFEFDARVTRAGQALVGEGAEVHVIALAVPGVLPDREAREGLEVHRCHKPLQRLRERVARAGVGTSATATPGLVRGTVRRGTGGPWRRWARHLLRLPSPLRAATELVLDRRFEEELEALRPDVVHAHDLNTLRAALRHGDRHGVAVVYDAHELHRARNGASWLERRFALRRERRLAPRATAVVAASPGYADDMAVHLRIARPVVVRNVPQAPPRRVEDLHELAGLDRSLRLVVHQGSLQPGRGVEALVDAMPLLPGVGLVVIGFGHHRDALEARARASAAAGRIAFVGRVPHERLLEVTAGGDVGACTVVPTSPSYALSLPNKLFEYLVADLPVLVSQGGPMAQVVAELGAGVACDPADPSSVAEGLREILDGPRAGAMRAAAARIELTWDVEKVHLLDVYRAALADTGQR